MKKREGRSMQVTCENKRRHATRVCREDRQSRRLIVLFTRTLQFIGCSHRPSRTPAILAEHIWSSVIQWNHDEAVLRDIEASLTTARAEPHAVASGTPFDL